MKRSRSSLKSRSSACCVSRRRSAKTADLCRQHGISSATFYAWKAKFGGMDVSEAKRLKALRGGECPN